MIQSLSEILSLFGFGLIAITSIAVLGSITSRILNYEYVYLTPLSLFLYGIVGYWGYHLATIQLTLLMVFALGVYDGTIGWKLSIILKANFGDKEEYAKGLDLAHRISLMLLLSGLLGLVGYFTAWSN